LSKAEYKVEGGKLVRVKLEVRDGKISYVMITGDFFMHPEELIENLESFLVGCKLDEAEIKSNLMKFVEDNGVVLLGVSVDDFAKCIMKAGESFG